MAELFDSIASYVDVSSFSDIEDSDEPIIRRTTKPRKINKKDENCDEISDSSNDEEEEVTQRRPAFSEQPPRERISRSSKTIAQEKISKMDDENTDFQKAIESRM